MYMECNKYVFSVFLSCMTLHGVALEFIILTSMCLVPGYLKSFLSECHIMYLDLFFCNLEHCTV